MHSPSVGVPAGLALEPLAQPSQVVSLDPQLKPKIQELRRRAEEAARASMTLPQEIPPPPPKRGWFDIGPKIENALQYLAQSRPTRTSLLRATRSANPRLVEATTFLSNLYKTLHGHNRAELIVAVREAKHALERILNASSEFSNIFYLPDLPENNQVPEEQIRATIQDLSLYLGYLEGKRGYICTKHDLYTLRTKIMTSLLTEEEATILRQNGELASYQGLLALFQRFKTSQEGVLDPVFAQLSQNLMRHLINAAGESFRPLMRRNVFAEAVSPIEDIDLPPLELLENSDKVRLNHTQEGLTFSKWVQAGLDFLKDGQTDGMACCACDILLKGLRRFEIYLQEEIANAPHILSPTHTTSAMLLSSPIALAQARPLANVDILNDLHGCIQILERIYRNGTFTDVVNAFSEIKRIMGLHPIWVGSVVNLSVEPITTDEEDVSGMISDCIQELHPAGQMDGTIPINEVAVTNLIEEVADIGSYQTTYQVLSYFIGERPSWIPEDNIPSFAVIMDRVSHITDPREKKTAIISQFRSLIANSAHIFFIKRWALWLFSYPILWLCELGVKSVANSAYSHLQQFIQNAHDPSGENVSTQPLERLKATIDGFFIAYKEHLSTHVGQFDNSEEALKTYINTNQNFLKNHGTLSEIFYIAGDLAVDRYMFSCNPTRFLSRVTDGILKWVSASKYPIVSLFLTVTTLPITLSLWTFNTLLIRPIEWGLNWLIQFTTKTLLRKTHALANMCELTGDALFSEASGHATTRVMNTVIINLLKKLSDLMNEPSDPNSDFFDTTVATNNADALGDTLLSVLKLIAIMKVKTPDDMTRFINAEHTSGIHNQLGNLLKFVFKKDLDGEVVDAAKILLTRFYRLLMDPEIINQQLFLALTSAKEGMLAKATPPSPAETLANQKEELRLKRLATSHRKKVIQQAAILAHAPVGGDDRDRGLKEHVLQIKRDLLGSSEQSGILISWKTRLLEAYPLTIATLDHLHAELLTVWGTLQDTLLQLEAEGIVGSGSLSVHKKNLRPIIEELTKYHKAFLTIYNQKLREELAYRDEITTHFASLYTTLSSLAVQSHDHLQSNLSTLQQIFHRIAELLNNAEYPQDLQHFITSYRLFVLNDAPEFIRNFETHKHFHLFQEEMENCSDLVSSFVESGNHQGLYNYFQTMNQNLKPLPESASIRALQGTIVDCVQRAQTPDARRTQSAVSLRRLQTLVRQTGTRLSSQSQNDHARAKIMMQSLAERSREQMTFLQDDTPSTPSSSESSIDAAHVLQDLITPLEELSQAVDNLKDISAIRIPLDQIPFFRTTVDQITVPFDRLIEDITNLFTSSKAAFTGIIARQVVIPFIEL